MELGFITEEAYWNMMGMLFITAFALVMLIIIALTGLLISLIVEKIKEIKKEKIK